LFPDSRAFCDKLQKHLGGTIDEYVKRYGKKGNEKDRKTKGFEK
jgi:hypothetical protein